MFNTSSRLLVVLFVSAFAGCTPSDKEISSIDPVNWKQRQATPGATDSLETGASYLSVYSEIYGKTEHITHMLTATVSMRNPNAADSIFLTSADYYNSQGALIRSYFNHPIYLAPMETVDIIIDEEDETGGTGANFMFHWHKKPGTHDPIFEGIMISTSGQQGLSFSTQGVRLK
jgi:hypothetical protein